MSHGIVFQAGHNATDNCTFEVKLVKATTEAFNEALGFNY